MAATPSRTRTVTQQLTSPSNMLYVGPSGQSPSRGLSKLAPHEDNLNTQTGGIGAFIASADGKVRKHGYEAGANAHTDHVQTLIFDGSWGKYPEDRPATKPGTPAITSTLDALGGVAGYLAKTSSFSLPAPPKTHDNVRKGAVETSNGGIFGYLAAMESGAEGADTVRDELRAGLGAKSSKANATVQATKAALREAGGIGAFVMGPADGPANIPLPGLSRKAASESPISTAMRDGRLGRSLGEYLASPAPPPRRYLAGPEGGLDKYGGGSLPGFFEAPGDPPKSPHPNARRGQLVDVTGEDAPLADLGAYMHTGQANVPGGGPKNSGNRAQLDTVGGLVGSQDAVGKQALWPANGQPYPVVQAAHEQQSSARVQAVLAGMSSASSPRRDSLSHFGAASSTAVHLASGHELPMNYGRLRGLQAAVQEQLPSDAATAVLSLKHQLSRVDGDRDGVLEEEELRRALSDFAPGKIQAGDVGYLARYIREEGSAAATPLHVHAGAQASASSGSSGASSAVPAAHSGLTVEQVTAFFTGSAAPTSAPTPSAAAAAAAGGIRRAAESQAPVRPAVSTSTSTGAGTSAVMAAVQALQRMDDDLDRAHGFGAAGSKGTPSKGGRTTGHSSTPGRADDEASAKASSTYKWHEFRNAWEAKHGTPAAKELSHDASTPAEGPSWKSANPSPFKVLRLTAGASPAKS